jgi:hypothetical protein
MERVGQSVKALNFGQGKSMASNSGDKTGGRKKDTPNKKSKDLIDLAEQMSVSPFEIMLHFASGNFKALGMKEYQIKSSGMGKTYEELSILPEMRLNAAYKAAQFLHPKRKAIEIRQETSSKISFVTQDEFNKAKS